MKHHNNFLIFFTCIPMFLLAFSACNGTNYLSKDKKIFTTYSGLYSVGPKITAFTLCEDASEYWVIDSAELEASYTKFGFDKPYTPVYIEVKGYITKSDTSLINADYDSTIVVTKVIKITKNIPEGPCL